MSEKLIEATRDMAISIFVCGIIELGWVIVTIGAFCGFRLACVAGCVSTALISGYVIRLHWQKCRKIIDAEAEEHDEQ